MAKWDPKLACCEWHTSTGFEPGCPWCQEAAYTMFPPDWESTEAQLDKASDASFEFPES